MNSLFEKSLRIASAVIISFMKILIVFPSGHEKPLILTGMIREIMSTYWRNWKQKTYDPPGTRVRLNFSV